LIEGGIADQLRNSLQGEVARRIAIAQQVLAGLIRENHPPSLHIWLDVSALAAERAANGARQRGVSVTPPGAPIVDPRLISGMRVSIGAPPTIDRLELALLRLRAAFDNENDADLSII
jgi:hypothetical protein